MKIFETWRTWLLIIGLLLFSALASVVYLTLEAEADTADVDTGAGSSVVSDTGLPLVGDFGGFERSEPIVIELDEYLLGEVLVEVPGLRELNGRQVHPLLLTGILAAIIVGGLFVIGVPLALIYVRLDQQTTTLKEDPDFKEAQAELQQREKARFKELAQERPAVERPDHRRPRVDLITTTAVIMMLVFFLGFALSDTFFPEGEIELGATGQLINPAIPLSLTLAFLTLLGLIFVFSNFSFADINEEEGVDETPIPWGTVWVVVTGLIFIGIGVGLMLALGAG